MHKVNYGRVSETIERESIFTLIAKLRIAPRTIGGLETTVWTIDAIEKLARDMEDEISVLKRLQPVPIVLNIDLANKPSTYEFGDHMMISNIEPSLGRMPLTMHSRSFYKNGKPVGHVYYGARDSESGRSLSEQEVIDVLGDVEENAPGFKVK